MVSTMDPYVKMRLTTQSYRTKTIKSGGKAPAFNEDFAFYVNSDSIAEGRILEIAVMDQNSTFNPQIGYGIVDCDPIIMNKLANISQKCYIVHNGKSAGYVNLQFSFREELLGILFIHILNASIRRKTSTISDMQCRARLTIGEEITATEKSRDTKNEAPHWNEVFRIPIIRSNETGIIEIIDIGVNSETLVGDCEINVQELVEPTGEGYH
jgi:Ca2+-dependent lipid-binding protein